jgi:hypothetical protein
MKTLKLSTTTRSSHWNPKSHEPALEGQEPRMSRAAGTMDTFEEALHKIAKQLPHIMLGQLLDKKLKAQGIKLSKRKIRELVSRVLDGHEENITFDDKRKRTRTVKIDLTDDDLDHMTRRLDDFIKNDVPRVTENFIEDTATNIFQLLRARWRRESRVYRREMEGFRKRLTQRWGPAIEGLKMLVAISREVGPNAANELSNAGDFNAPHTLYVLSRLHARACQVVEEVICLLSNGFADGAMGRWRTLHEIAAVSLLISEHGDDLAERYISHEIVETRRAALQYEKFRARLGEEPLSQEELRKIEEVYNNTIQRFGREFRYPRGWASKHLNKTKPTIADINEAARLDHLSPYYRLASDNVHADPKGSFFKLGIIDETEMLLAGPSDAGLADPGFNTIRSFNQISSALLCLRWTFENVVALKVMIKLGDEIVKSFSDAHERLLQDDRAFRQQVLALEEKHVRSFKGKKSKKKRGKKRVSAPDRTTKKPRH